MHNLHIAKWCVSEKPCKYYYPLLDAVVHVRLNSHHRQFGTIQSLKKGKGSSFTSYIQLKAVHTTIQAQCPLAPACSHMNAISSPWGEFSHAGPYGRSALPSFISTVMD